MRIGRTIPPAAAPLSVLDLVRGLTGMLGTGNTRKLENEIREYFGSESVFLVSSGKAALTLILSGLSSLRPRKKVLIPAYTCYSVPSAIVKTGLEIVLCDVDPDTLDFDYDQLESRADENTLCVVPTHLFGIPSDIDRVRRICGSKGIFLVEDAAQSMGVAQGNRKLGTLGDVGFFSLGRGKNITCGSGGIILTSAGEIAQSIRKLYRELKRVPTGETLRDIAEALFMKAFLDPRLYWFPSGMPFLGIGETRFSPDFPIYRLNNFKAGLLASWRERMEEYNHGRTMNGRSYSEELDLRKCAKIYAQDLPFLRFPVYADTPEGKSEACRRFKSSGVSPLYPRSVNRIEQLREQFAGREYPGAERITSTLMTLPTHGYITDSDRVRICNSIGFAHRARKKGNISMTPNRYAG